MSAGAGSEPGLGAGELQRRALRGVTWSSLSVLVSLPLAIAVSVILARSLGPEQFARFALLSFLTPVLLVAGDLGFTQATLREASQAFAAGQLDRTRVALRKALGWNLLRLPVAYALLLGVARPGIAVSLVVIIGLGLQFAGSGLLFSIQAENRGATGAKLGFVHGLAAAATGIVAAVSGASGTTVWAVILASGVVIVPGWLLLSNPDLRSAGLRPAWPRRLPTGFWRYGLTAALLLLLTTLVFSRSEIVILELLGEHHALAVFALAFGLSQRLTTPVDTLLGPLIPALTALAGAHADHMDAGFARALRLSCVGVTILGGAAVVGTMLAAPVLFGREYQGTGTVFAALAAISLLQSALQPYTAVAYALGQLGVLVRAYVVALVVDVAMAMALIPPFGIWGAVVSNVAGGLIALALTVRGLSVVGGVRDAGVPAGRLLMVAALSASAAYGAGVLVGGIHPVAGIVAAYSAGSACVLVMAALTGGLVRADDAEVLLGVLPVRVARAARRMIPLSPAPALA